MATTSFASTVVSVAPTSADVFTIEVLTVKRGFSKAGNDRMYLETLVTDGARTGESQAGCTIGEGFNLPRDAKQIEEDQKNKRDTPDKQKNDRIMSRMWMEFFISCGFDQSEVREKGFDFDKVDDPKAFEYLIGRTGFVKYTPADPDEGHKWPKKMWLTDAQAGAYADAHAEVKAAASSSGGDDDPLGSFLNG